MFDKELRHDKAAAAQFALFMFSAFILPAYILFCCVIGLFTRPMITAIMKTVPLLFLIDVFPSAALVLCNISYRNRYGWWAEHHVSAYATRLPEILYAALFLVQTIVIRSVSDHMNDTTVFSYLTDDECLTFVLVLCAGIALLGYSVLGVSGRGWKKVCFCSAGLLTIAFVVSAIINDLFSCTVYEIVRNAVQIVSHILSLLAAACCAGFFEDAERPDYIYRFRRLLRNIDTVASFASDMDGGMYESAGRSGEDVFKVLKRADSETLDFSFVRCPGELRRNRAEDVCRLINGSAPADGETEPEPFVDRADAYYDPDKAEWDFLQYMQHKSFVKSFFSCAALAFSVLAGIGYLYISLTGGYEVTGIWLLLLFLCGAALACAIRFAEGELRQIAPVIFCFLVACLICLERHDETGSFLMTAAAFLPYAFAVFAALLKNRRGFIIALIYAFTSDFCGGLYSAFDGFSTEIAVRFFADACITAAGILSVVMFDFSDRYAFMVSRECVDRLKSQESGPDRRAFTERGMVIVDLRGWSFEYDSVYVLVCNADGCFDVYAADSIIGNEIIVKRQPGEADDLKRLIMSEN